MSTSAPPRTYSAIRDTLDRRLLEPAPGRVQILTGPRQVGKTHLLRRIEEGFEGRVRYAAADAPEASLPGWWELQWREAQRLAGTEGPGILILDEIQYLPDWSRRLKAEHDHVTRLGTPLHVIASGSSALKLGRGARESMAGRFERLELLHWPAKELVRHFALDEDRAVDVAVTFGAYPGAVPLLGDPKRWKSYVLEAIIEPAIGRDVMAMEVVRKPALLRQVFSLAAGHPAEIVSLQKLQAQLLDKGALETLAHYLQLLEEAYLIAPLEKLAVNATRRRAAPPKLVVLSQGILAALEPLGSPAASEDPVVRGRRVENACIAHAWNAGQTVRYWRAEPLEVDMVLAGSWGTWAVEVKTGQYNKRDLAGLLELTRRHPEFRPLLLCGRGEEALARRAGVSCCSWHRFLLSGPPS